MNIESTPVGRKEFLIGHIKSLRAELDAVHSRLKAAEKELREMDDLRAPATLAPPRQHSDVDAQSSTDAKVELFRQRFRGRTDAFATSWFNAKIGKKSWSPRTTGYAKFTDVKAADLVPLTDKVIYEHLAPTAPGVRPFQVGLYPLLNDDQCYLLACDFDKGSWRDDARAYYERAKDAGFDALIEISSSGNGAHVWIFFSDKVPAISARALGTGLLRTAMSRSTGLTMNSYDRFFPSQDTLPTKSRGAARLGNLIALPLEGNLRQEQCTVFVDPESFVPFEDQFLALSRVQPATGQQLSEYLSQHSALRLGPQVAFDDPPRRPRRSELKKLVDNVELPLKRTDRLYVPTNPLPSSILTELKHLASQSNPDFYRRQAQRYSTYGVPRLVQCFEHHDDVLVLPRGVTDEVSAVLTRVGFKVKISYPRRTKKRLEVSFHGELRPNQNDAIQAMEGHREGVIVSPTGSGKTVMACALIAQRKVPTAILVNNTQLLGQWRRTLESFLDLEPGQIGQWGDGVRKLTGLVDLVMVQSMRSRNSEPVALEGYGQIIVDECHSVGAPSTLASVERIKALYWVGLTATPYRADELNGLITMQCGPIRYDMTTPSAAIRELIVHASTFDLERDSGEFDIQELYSLLALDRQRNEQIVADICAELETGRHCLVLSNRTGHVTALVDLLKQNRNEPVIELHGRLSKAERRIVDEQLMQHSESSSAYVVVAADKIAGQGFDLPSLDTLFLVSPVSFRGKIEQLLGRIQRSDDSDRLLRVHDYVDAEVPIFKSMATRRHRVILKRGFHRSSPEQHNAVLTGDGQDGVMPYPGSSPTAPGSSG